MKGGRGGKEVGRGESEKHHDIYIDAYILLWVS